RFSPAAATLTSTSLVAIRGTSCRMISSTSGPPGREASMMRIESGTACMQAAYAQRMAARQTLAERRSRGPAVKSVPFLHALVLQRLEAAQIDLRRRGTQLVDGARIAFHGDRAAIAQHDGVLAAAARAVPRLAHEASGRSVDLLDRVAVFALSFPTRESSECQQPARRTRVHDFQLQRTTRFVTVLGPRLTQLQAHGRVALGRKIRSRQARQRSRQKR